MVTHDKLTLQEMICVLEPIMERPNLDVKASKCAELYGRRSWNNWYTVRNNKKPSIDVQNKNIEKNSNVLKRNESCRYLGESITINDDDRSQVYVNIAIF